MGLSSPERKLGLLTRMVQVSVGGRMVQVWVGGSVGKMFSIVVVSSLLTYNVYSIAQ